MTRLAAQTEAAWEKSKVRVLSVAVCTVTIGGTRSREQADWYTPSSQNNLGRARARLASFKQAEFSRLAELKALSPQLKLVCTVVRLSGIL